MQQSGNNRRGRHGRLLGQSVWRGNDITRKHRFNAGERSNRNPRPMYQRKLDNKRLLRGVIYEVLRLNHAVRFSDGRIYPKYRANRKLRRIRGNQHINRNNDKPADRAVSSQKRQDRNGRDRRNRWNVRFYIDNNTGDLMLSYSGSNAPNLSLNSNGELIYTY